MKKLITLLLFSLFLSSCNQTISPKISQVIQETQNIQETIAPKPTVIIAGLPDKHQIAATFIPQAPEKNWDEPWQDACEEAALLTVKYYYESATPSLTTILADYQQIFSYESQNKFTSDMNTTQMSQVASNLYDLTPTIINNPTIEDIKKYIAHDIPVIVPANGKTLFNENKRFKNGGPWYHNIVILGYDDNRQQFTVHDVGTQFGAYFHYSYSLLMRSIHDFPLAGSKEEIDTGDKKVLVLLK